MTQAKRMLSVNTLSHFAVDFACFFVLFRGIAAEQSPQAATVAFLIYNVIAFGTQPLIGFFRDERRLRALAPAGVLCVLAGVLLLPFPYVALGFVAVGNAAFHVGGGADTLLRSEGKIGPNGVFVASGALGVLLGTLMGRDYAVQAILPIGLLAACAGLFFVVLRMDEKPLPQQTRAFCAPGKIGWGVALGLLLVAVLLRSLGGTLVQTPWKDASFLLYLPALGAFAGKAAGGVLADRLGARWVGALGPLLSIPLLCLGSASPVLTTAGIFLFNLAMPVTLCAVAQRLPRHPGLAFGLTTLALLLGSMPVFFIALGTAPALWVLGACGALSCGCIFLGIGNGRARDAERSVFS